ncbi:MAG: hypothetical protein WBX38_02080 [Candidatus Sulfotelmatobacter sp.]
MGQADRAGAPCDSGTIVTPWTSSSNPNTANAPDPTGGQHFDQSNASCPSDEDNTLFAWKDDPDASNALTNFLWDFWFYVPTSTNPNNIQALESDLFMAVKMEDGDVHEFMFGSQCYYDGTAKGAGYDTWEFAYPQSNEWTDSPGYSCQPTRPESSTVQYFTEGEWHHATYYYQRVTPNGSSPAYQNIVGSPSSSNGYKYGRAIWHVDNRRLYLLRRRCSAVVNSESGMVAGAGGTTSVGYASGSVRDD